jgi:hypothetical protein
MKNNKLIFKIVVATLACFVISFLIAKFAGLNHDDSYPDSIFKRYAGQFKCSPEDNANQSTTIIKKFEAKEIHEIELTLISANIEITQAPSTATELHYTGAQGLKLTDKIEGSILKLTDAEGSQQHGWRVNCGPGFGGFNFNINASKTDATLKLQIPPSIESLTIHTVGGDLRITQIPLKHLEIKTVSGNIQATGDYPDFIGRTVSGDFVLENAAISPKIEIVSTSGDLKLRIKKSVNATLMANAVSGDFAIAGEEKIIANAGSLSSQKIFGKGTGKISLRTVSGDMRVELIP